MTVPTATLRRIARGAAILAVVTGLVGALSLLGAFGPVACTTESASGSGAASADGTNREGSTDRVRTPHDCVSGIEYLLGDAGGNAAALFFWPLGLAALVALGGAAAWTGRRRLAWVAAGTGAVVSVTGFLSIGWYFVLPTSPRRRRDGAHCRGPPAREVRRVGVALFRLFIRRATRRSGTGWRSPTARHSVRSCAVTVTPFRGRLN